MTPQCPRPVTMIVGERLPRSQATHITFICPMRFDKFPMDTQTCLFKVGSYSYDSTKMIFQTGSFGYSTKETNGIALDYDISKFF